MNTLESQLEPLIMGQFFFSPTNMDYWIFTGASSTHDWGESRGFFSLSEKEEKKCIIPPVGKVQYKWDRVMPLEQMWKSSAILTLVNPLARGNEKVPSYLGLWIAHIGYLPAEVRKRESTGGPYLHCLQWSRACDFILPFFLFFFYFLSFPLLLVVPLFSSWSICLSRTLEYSRARPHSVLEDVDLLARIPIIHAWILPTTQRVQKKGHTFFYKLFHLE